MADFPQYPKVYGSMFKDKVYDIVLIRRRTVNTKFGESTILHVQVSPEVYSKKQDEMISEGEWWFSHPGGQYHDEKEWAFLESISGIFDGGTFKLERGPQGLCAGGEGTTAPKPPAPAGAAPAAPQAAPAPRVDVFHRLADNAALHRYIRSELSEEMAPDSAEFMPTVSTLYIQACKQGINDHFSNALALKTAGPKPEADDDGLAF